MVRTLHPKEALSRRVRGFTLIELLTVIAIVAVLATLLTTTLGSVKRRAREVVCTSNLRQIGIGLHLYLDDFKKRPGDLVTLASSKYCGDARILRCPAEPMRALTLASGTAAENGEQKTPVSNASASVHVSYLHPLGWPDEEWDRLMQASTRAGVVACTWHDIRAGAQGAALSDLARSEMILRGQLDGTVVRRHVPSAPTTLPPQDTKGTTAAFGPETGGARSNINSNSPPWIWFSDDPAP